jgi:crossover junction endodeoxyribonuclease RuvC
MRVLAIDPGFGRCGIAVLERTSGKDRLLFSDCVETSATTSFPERLRTVTEAVEAVMARFHPEAFALEKLFMGKNKKTAMQIAEVRGALISSATAARIPVFEYSPGEVKSASTGWGKADKRQVATMVRALLTIERPVTRDDEYDAIAIGLTHLAHIRPVAR